MEKSSDLLDKILDFFQNATMERVLLLSGLALVLFGVVGQVYGFGPVLPGQEWVLIVLGTLLMPAAVALYLLDRNDRVAAALFGAGGLIVATVLMVVFLLADPPVELASFTATPFPSPATVTRLSPTPSATASPTTTFTASPTETGPPAATESPASTVTTSPTETTSLETATPEP